MASEWGVGIFRFYDWFQGSGELRFLPSPREGDILSVFCCPLLALHETGNRGQENRRSASEALHGGGVIFCVPTSK